MEDERIVPVPISVYKAEVWHNLGLMVTSASGLWRERNLGSAGSGYRRAFAWGAAGGSVAARLELSLVLGARRVVVSPHG